MTGAVYDRGYRPYEGERGGRRRARCGAVPRVDAPGPRASAGPGGRRWRRSCCSASPPSPPSSTSASPTSPGTRRRQDIDFITYREYVGVSNALLVFVALTAPDIMCPDRRQRVLPLIFARPLTGVDYVLAKVGAMFAILFAFSFLPQVVLFVGQMLVSDDGALALRPRQRRGPLAGAGRGRRPARSSTPRPRRGHRVADVAPDHRRGGRSSGSSSVDVRSMVGRAREPGTDRGLRRPEDGVVIIDPRAATAATRST